MPSKNESGTRIPGYKLKKKLGEGAMGKVYKAIQISMDRPVAIKILSPDLKNDESYTKRFFREARSVAKLNHPNIIRGIDVGEHEGLYYFVMEYVEGRTLREIFEENGKIPEEDVLDIGEQIGQALSHAEENNLIHRDIKPDNIMIDQEGRAKLCDLGLAKPVVGDNANLTQTNISIGTPYYMSPEQITDENDVSIQTDIYSLGATLYHVLTGQVPYDGDHSTAVMTSHITDDLVPPRDVDGTIRRGTDVVIRRMLAQDPSERYQHPDEFVEDFKRLQEGKSPKFARAKPQKRTSSGDKKPRYEGSRKSVESKKGSGWKPIALVGGAAVLGGLILLFIFSGNNSTTPGNNNDSKNPKAVESTPQNNQSPGDSTDRENNPAPNNEKQKELEKWQNEYRTLKENVSRFLDQEDQPALKSVRSLLSDIEKFQDKQKNKQLSEKTKSLRSKLLEQSAQRHLSPIQKKAKRALDKGHYLMALKTTEKVPDLFSDTEAGTAIRELRTSTRNQLTEKFKRMKQEVGKYLDENHFKKARARLGSFTGQLDAEMTPDLYRRMNRLKNRIYKRKREVAYEKKLTSREDFQNKLDEIDELIDLRSNPSNRLNVDRLVRRIENIAGSKKIKLQKHRQLLRSHKSDVKELRRFGKNLSETLAKAAQANSGSPTLKKSIKMKNFKGKLTKFNPDTNKIFIAPPGVSPEHAQPRELKKVPITERVQFQKKLIRDPTPEQRFRWGLVYYFGRAYPEAYFAFRQCQESGLQRSNLYLEKLRRRGFTKSWATAFRLIEQLREAVDKRNKEDVKRLLGKLENYKNESPYQEESGEEGLIAKAKHILKKPEEKDKKEESISLLSRFEGDVNVLNNQTRKVEVTFDFKNKKQFEKDWTEYRDDDVSFKYLAEKNAVRGETTRNGGRGRGRGRRRGRGDWLPRGGLITKEAFKKNVLIEALVSTPDGQNIGLLTMVQDDYSYFGLANFTFDFRGREGSVSGLYYYDITEWDLREQEDIATNMGASQLPSGTPFSLRQKQSGPNIKLQIKKPNTKKYQTLHEGSHKKLTSGQTGVFLTTTEIVIYRVRIVGNLKKAESSSGKNRDGENENENEEED